MRPTEARTRRGAVELVFHEWPGGDPPTLLLHGIGNYGRYWDFVAREICSPDGASPPAGPRCRLRLIAPDARGHGSSGRPDADAYAPREFVADALAILDALAIERALVVGHSMGGSHALHLAAEHPERVLGLMLVDVGVEPMREGSERARRLTLTRPESFADRGEAEAYLRRTSPGYRDEVYADRLDHLFREEEATAGSGAAAGAPRASRETPSASRETPSASRETPSASRLVWRSSSPALARIMSSRTETEGRWQTLAAVRCPLVIVRGTRSNVLSSGIADRMRRERALAQPGVRTDLLEVDAGHNVPLDRPRELAEAMESLARSVWTAPGAMRRGSRRPAMSSRPRRPQHGP